jgi:hypothetical protein
MAHATLVTIYILCFTVAFIELSNSSQYSKRDVGENQHLVVIFTDFISITIDVYIVVVPQISVCITLKSVKLYESNEDNTPRTGIYHILI